MKRLFSSIAAVAALTIASTALARSDVEVHIQVPANLYTDRGLYQRPQHGQSPDANITPQRRYRVIRSHGPQYYSEKSRGSRHYYGGPGASRHYYSDRSQGRHYHDRRHNARRHYDRGHSRVYDSRRRNDYLKPGGHLQRDSRHHYRPREHHHRR